MQHIFYQIREAFSFLVFLILLSGVSEPDPYWIQIRWSSSSGSVFGIRILIQVLSKQKKCSVNTNYFQTTVLLKKRALVIWKIIFYTITLSILKKGENLNPIWIRYGSTALLQHFLTIQQQTFFSSDRLKKKRGSGSVQKRTRIRNTD